MTQSDLLGIFVTVLGCDTVLYLIFHVSLQCWRVKHFSLQVMFPSSSSFLPFNFQGQKSYQEIYEKHVLNLCVTVNKFSRKSLRSMHVFNGWIWGPKFCIICSDYFQN